jgi:hypothetical protein
MSGASLEGKTARELQEELARQAPAARRKRRAQPLSRAARLHLIDIVSRWSGPGLALVAGVSIYLAVVAGRAYPARAATWTLMMLTALWVCRRLRNEFRAGGSASSHPFRWRASFTACLSVLGVIFASAPILLAPAAASTAFAAQVMALAVIASFAAALMLAGHFPSAAAIAFPGAAFVVLAALRAGDSGLLVAVVSTSLLGVAGLVLASRHLEKSAARRYPRTALLRREVERQTATQRPISGAAASALKA